MLTKGSKQVLHPETVREMLRKQNTDAPLDLDVASGLSWQLTHRLSNELNAGPMAWHEGWLWHFSSAMAILPTHRLGVVVAANTDSAKSSVSKIAKAVLRRLLWQKKGVQRAEYVAPPEEIRLAPETLASYEGHYDTPSGLVDIRLSDDYLEWRTESSRMRLIPLADGTFAMDAFLTSVITYRSPELDGKRLQFVQVSGDTVVATLDHRVRIPLGRKVTPVAIPPSWTRRLGTYVNTGAGDDFVKVKQVELDVKDGFLVARIVMGGPFTRDMPMTVALKPDTNERAFVMGVGRYRGDVLRLNGRGRRAEMRFQGYTLTRQSR